MPREQCSAICTTSSATERTIAGSTDYLKPGEDGEGGTTFETERAWHRIERRLHAQRFGDPARQNAFEAIA